MTSHLKQRTDRGAGLTNRRKYEPLEIIQLVAFAVFAFVYAIYMAGYLPGSAYMASLAIVLGVAVTRIASVVARTGVHSLVFGRSALAIMAVAPVFIGITWFKEWGSLGYLTWTSVGECLFFVGPAILALSIANSVDVRLADIYIGILLARYITYMALAFGSDFSLTTIMSINWGGSYSPFETSFAHDLLIIEGYLIYRSRKVVGAAAAALTMLSLKRASFILAPLMILAGPWLRKPARPRTASLVAAWSAAVAGPFIVAWLYSPSVAAYLAREYSLNLGDFASGRQRIYTLATEVLPENHGFGWLNGMLRDYVGAAYGTVWNSSLHNDTVRVYIEVGALGLIGYLAAIVYMGRTSRMSLLLVCYALFVLTTSRLITASSFWFALFIVLALIEYMVSLSDSESLRRRDKKCIPR